MLVADSERDDGGLSIVGVVRLAEGGGSAGADEAGKISRYAVGTRPEEPKPAEILVQPPSVICVRISEQ